MLKAEDLNRKVDAYAQQILLPKGFKKAGLHYFKSEPPHYYALIKDTFKGLFNDYYLVYSHEAAGQHYRDVLRKPQSLLRYYPVSVRVNDLPFIYKQADFPELTPYTFFSLARSYDVDPDCYESEAVWRDHFRLRTERDELLKSSEPYLEHFVQEMFGRIESHGFRFFADCNLALCFHAIDNAIVNKKKEQYAPWYLDFKREFEAYCLAHNEEIPSYRGHHPKAGFGKRIAALFSRKR